jgi:hypothetical protein
LKEKNIETLTTGEISGFCEDLCLRLKKIQKLMKLERDQIERLNLLLNAGVSRIEVLRPDTVHQIFSDVLDSIPITELTCAAPQIVTKIEKAIGKQILESIQEDSLAFDIYFGSREDYSGREQDEMSIAIKAFEKSEVINQRLHEAQQLITALESQAEEIEAHKEKRSKSQRQKMYEELKKEFESQS